jgi:predicted AAA+ superfamily ATPase
MIDRPFWSKKIESAWREAPIVWLSGVRRSGKTTIAQSLDGTKPHFVNCDIPAVEEMVRDPVLFFQNCPSPVVVFDEIHQLRDPARLLKIGADMFPEIKILATGSSTLAAGKKFCDTLTGRKRTVHLVPVLLEELKSFGSTLERRLFHGGLPPALLAEQKKPAFYREWMDSFFARDIQRLFGFRDINRFTAFLEHVFRQSGGQFDVSKPACPTRRPFTGGTNAVAKSISSSRATATPQMPSSANGIPTRLTPTRWPPSGQSTRKAATSSSARQAHPPMCARQKA